MRDNPELLKTLEAYKQALDLLRKKEEPLIDPETGGVDIGVFCLAVQTDKELSDIVDLTTALRQKLVKLGFFPSKDEPPKSPDQSKRDFDKFERLLR